MEEIKNNIEQALEHGIHVKLNSIVINRFNDDEMYDIADYCFNNKILLRFLELYLSGPVKNWFSAADCLSHDQILERMKKRYGSFVADMTYRGNGASRYYSNSTGKIFGIVNNESTKKCVGCDRLRLSVNGIIRFCTFAPVDLRCYLDSEEKLSKKLVEMSALFDIRGMDYIGKRKHEIDYYFRWNQNNSDLQNGDN